MSGEFPNQGEPRYNNERAIIPLDLSHGTLGTYFFVDIDSEIPGSENGSPFGARRTLPIKLKEGIETELTMLLSAESLEKPNSMDIYEGPSLLVTLNQANPQAQFQVSENTLSAKCDFGLGNMVQVFIGLPQYFDPVE